MKPSAAVQRQDQERTSAPTNDTSVSFASVRATHPQRRTKAEDGTSRRHFEKRLERMLLKDFAWRHVGPAAPPVMGDAPPAETLKDLELPGLRIVHNG
eukprot:Skav206633  [mRNA]  locus=scaffold2313:151785:156123:- [translate_table: standard]